MTMTARVTGVDATYYYVKDMDRALDFYTKMLGVAPSAHMPGVFAEWVFGDDSSFGIYKSGEFHAGGSVMFAVPDVPAALADVKALGATVVDHVEETPFCTMGFANDTEGNAFILHRRKTTD